MLKISAERLLLKLARQEKVRVGSRVGMDGSVPFYFIPILNAVLHVSAVTGRNCYPC